MNVKQSYIFSTSVLLNDGLFVSTCVVLGTTMVSTDHFFSEKTSKSFWLKQIIKIEKMFEYSLLKGES